MNNTERSGGSSMKIERFSASDMSKAIRIVKNKLGPDAVILSNDRIGGQVEVLAASGYDESMFDRIPKLNESMGERPVAVPNIELQAELTELKESLRDELAALRRTRQQPRTVPSTEGASRFQSLGFTPELVSSVMQRHPGEDWRTTSASLNNILRDVPIATDNLLDTGGVVVLLGPTGVGKTTTAAKIAARFALKHGRNEVALITTDSNRIGGHEQLGSYARALNVPMEIVSTGREMKSAVASFSDRRLVLIDTAGRSQRDIQLARQLPAFASLPDLKACLVLSATSQEGLPQQVFRTFSKVPLSATIVTKTDEAVAMGAVLSGVLKSRIPLAWLCGGQNVPEDLERASLATLTSLCRRMYREMQQSQSIVRQAASA
ncbi:MAG: hypothetical protein AAF525_11830 [Pseudomonadota bacterium]